MKETIRGRVASAWALALVLFFISALPLVAASRIKFTTKLSQGATITLQVGAGEVVTATGLRESIIADGKPHDYTLESSEVKLFGPITQFCAIQQQLTELDLRSATELITLDCSNNMISKLDVQLAKKLEEINCSLNSLSNLNVAPLTELRVLRLSSNTVASLSLSKCAKLEELDFSDNYYPVAVDVSACPQLKILKVHSNKFRELTLSKNPLLEELYCDNNEIKTLDLEANPLLQVLSVSGNDRLSTVKISGSALRVFDCYSTGIGNFNPKLYPNLERLSCAFSAIRALDLSLNPKLKVLSCSKLSLATLDVSHNPLLEELRCNDNGLQELDLSQNLKLSKLSCLYNELQELDLSEHTRLTWVNVSGNRLSTLNLGKAVHLETLACTNNQLSQLILPVSEVLTHLEVYSNKLSAEHIAEIVELLPDRHGKSRGYFRLLDSKDKSEVNNCTMATVARAVGKFWRVVDYAGFAHIGQGIDYRGSDAPAQGNGVIKLTFAAPGSIRLMAETLGELTATGLQEPIVNGRELVTYTLQGREVVLRGDIYMLTVEEGQLESATFEHCDYLRKIEMIGHALSALDLGNMPGLTSLSLESNALASLKIGEMPLLTEVSCYNNMLPEAVGTQFFVNLPQRLPVDKAQIIWIDSRNSEEKNILTNAMIKEAREKGWRCIDYAGGEKIEIREILFAPRIESLAVSSLRLSREGKLLRVEGAIAKPLSLYDLSGIALRTVNPSSTGEATISLEGLPSGVYVVANAEQWAKLLL